MLQLVFLCMEKIQILVIGRNEQIVQTVVRLINNNEAWKASFALTDADAIRLFENQAFDLVLFGGGIEPDSDTLLRSVFTAQRPQTIIIQHYGGGSGLLATEINMALEARV
jgi:hypothetical protein